MDGVNEDTLRLATCVSAFPFYNFRYLKLLSEFSRRFLVYCFAGSKLKGSPQMQGAKVDVRYVLPFTLPRRIMYHLGPYLSQPWISLVEHDVVWLFDTASPIQPLLFSRPVVLDVDDPLLVLPLGETRAPRLARLREYAILRNRKVSKIVVPTEIIWRKFVELGIEEEKIELIPNGVDTSLFKPSPLPEEPVVLYYGTFQTHRAILLLEVIKHLSKMSDKVRFLLIGDIPRWFKNRLNEFNFGNRVEMPGFVNHDELPIWIAEAKVCLLPQDRSLGGRLSFKLLEYMACGRPVVATAVDESFPVRESGAGIITPIDPQAMAEAILTLLNDRKLATKMGMKGVEYARRFDWNMMVKKYIELFQKVANQA